jgi:DNA-binding SARP family transcriptional activator
MPGRFSVHLIGGFGVRRDNSAVDLPPSCQRVIALSALAGRPVHRAWVCAQLWPDIPVRSSSARLRTTLWRLRPFGAEGLVSVDAQSVSLAHDVHVDWRRAVELCELLLGRRDEPAAPDAAVVDELLPMLTAGPLLDGWTEHWHAGERTRYHGLRTSTLGLLA